MLATLILSAGLASSEGAAVSLLLPGTFHGEAVRARTGERWYGLFPVSTGFAWRLATITTSSVLHSPEGLALPHSDPLELLLAKGPAYQLRVTDRRANRDAPEKPSRLILENESLEQALYEWPGGLLDEPCRLIWARDLDGAGELDLFLALSDHYNARQYTLFLSSRRTRSRSPAGCTGLLPTLVNRQPMQIPALDRNVDPPIGRRINRLDTQLRPTIA